MWRVFTIASMLAFAGCAQVPPSPQEITDRKMEPVAGKAVVFVVQPPFGTYSASLILDGGVRITTWPGTFYRWETTAGRHEIRSGESNLNARISLQVEAGRVYFVQHTVTGIRGSTTDASLSMIKEDAGRRYVLGAKPCCD